MLNRKITSKCHFVILFCLISLALAACANLGQVPAQISLPTPTAGKQGVNPYPLDDQSGEVIAQATDSATTGSPAGVPTIPPTAAETLETAFFTEADLKNAQYAIKDFASENGGSDTVPLQSGSYAYLDPGNPPDPSNFTVQYLKSSIGDLNGDSLPDAGVILVADTSGSGTFIYLAAMVYGNGTLENSDTIYLGDRVVIDSIAIQDGMIHLQMITHGPQDAMCCPSVKTTQTYLLDNGHLVSQAEKIAAPLAREVIQALKAKDMGKLSEFVDPSAGVRFSPYTNVKDNDQFFTSSQLIGAFSDSTVYTWGYYEGSGAPIQLTFSDYYERFVYSEDFASAAMIGYNHSLSSANVIDNSFDFYPNSIIVEYYLPGTNPSAGAGLDWQSVKLVFKQVPPEDVNSAGRWYLVGIIHSQWTI